MTRDGIQRALIDLGWLSVIQRVLGGKPSVAYALYQFLRAPGRPLLFADLALSYEVHLSGGGSMRVSRGVITNTDDAIRKRVERLRACLADLGVKDAILTIVGEGGYVLERCAVPLIETALLAACGIELKEDIAA
jgi:hypothetical protein